MIRHTLDLEERRRLCLALAMREDRTARLAGFRQTLWLALARPWMSFHR